MTNQQATATARQHPVTIPVTAPELSEENRTALTNLITLNWRHGAACAGQSVENWYVDEPSTIRAAVTICGHCPVRLACLATALLNDEHGIWGGTTQEDRDGIRHDWWLAEESDRPSHRTSI